MKTMIAAGLALLLPGAAQEPGVDLDLKNPDNLVAKRLEGTWTLREDLTLKLQGSDLNERASFTVTVDAQAVPDRILKKLGAKMKLTVYQMGRINLKGAEHPFILVGLHGNPHVIWFRERNGDPLGDAESFNLMIAPGKTPKEDLLFVGGDFNNQPFSAFGRSK
jgi:hypothetical protein